MLDLAQYPTEELLTMLGKLKNDPMSKCQKGKTTYKKAVNEKMDAIGQALIKRLQNNKILATCVVSA